MFSISPLNFFSYIGGNPWQASVIVYTRGPKINNRVCCSLILFSVAFVVQMFMFVLFCIIVVAVVFVVVIVLVVLVVLGCWLFVVDCWLLVIGCWLFCY